MKQKHIVIQALIVCIILYNNIALSAQTTSRFTVSGYVYEKNSRETLIGVNIYEPKLKIGSSSNIYGYYAINLPADSIQLIFSYIGYKPVVRNLDLRSNIRLDIELEGSIELEELIITDKFSNRISQVPQMSQIEIPVDQARKIPSLLGEKDMFKVIQLMPGVQSGTEGSSGFYVRGGST
nr:carboxypeptidase-like regulatory domain-containing protein [Bacteroidales bacterium]